MSSRALGPAELISAETRTFGSSTARGTLLVAHRVDFRHGEIHSLVRAEITSSPDRFHDVETEIPPQRFLDDVGVAPIAASRSHAHRPENILVEIERGFLTHEPQFSALLSWWQDVLGSRRYICLRFASWRSSVRSRYAPDTLHLSSKAEIR